MQTNEHANSDEKKVVRSIVFEGLRDFDQALYECARNLEYTKVQEIKQYRDEFYERSFGAKSIEELNQINERMATQAQIAHANNAPLHLIFTQVGIQIQTIEVADDHESFHFDATDDESLLEMLDESDARMTVDESAGLTASAVDKTIHDSEVIIANAMRRATLSIAEHAPDQQSFTDGMRWVSAMDDEITLTAMVARIEAVEMFDRPAIEQWQREFIANVAATIEKFSDKTHYPIVKSEVARILPNMKMAAIMALHAGSPAPSQNSVATLAQTEKGPAPGKPGSSGPGVR